MRAPDGYPGIILATNPTDCRRFRDGDTCRLRFFNETPTGHLFTFNGGSASSTAFDAATGKVLATIALGGDPEFAVADGRSRVYVNLEDKSEVLPLDSRSLTAGAPWPLAPCESPSGMAIDRVRRRLFIGCANKLMAVVDADNGHVLTTLPIGGRVDANAFDRWRAWRSARMARGRSPSWRRTQRRGYRVLENVPTEPRARTMAVDPKTHNVYLVTAQFGPPPAPTSENPHPRPTAIPGTFVLLVFGP